MRRITKYEIDIDDGPTISLTYEPIDNTILQAKVADSYVVAYLVHDSDCSDVEDMMGDAMGVLYSGHRYAPKDHLHAIHDALGLNSYGDPDYSSFEDKVKERVADEMYQEDYDDLDLTPEQWEDMEHRIERALETEWAARMEDGRLGDRDAIVLDRAEHGGQKWSISGGGMQCQWDTARGAGVWVPDKYMRLELEEYRGTDRREKAHEYCEQFLTEYNAIINGDVYGCIVETFDEQGELLDGDSCWRFIGSTYAEQALKEEFFMPMCRAVEAEYKEEVRTQRGTQRGTQLEPSL